MNKNIYLVLAIIFIVLIVMGSGAYSWNQQNMKRQKEETVSTWADWIECGGDIKEISDGNYQTDGRIILLNSIVEDEGENVSPPEIKIMVKKISNGTEKQPHYAILVDLNTEYIGSQDWKVNMVNEEENYPPKFKITEGQIDCKDTSSKSGLLTSAAKRRIESLYLQGFQTPFRNALLTHVECL